MPTSIQNRRDELVGRLREELRRRVRESGLTQRALEEANGFTRGYLSQVLQGHVTLTAKHVFGILLALGTPAEAIFARLSGDDRGSGRPERLSEIRERMAVYDAALKQLEQKGLLSPEPDAGRKPAEPSAATPGAATPAGESGVRGDADPTS